MQVRGFSRAKSSEMTVHGRFLIPVHFFLIFLMAILFFSHGGSHHLFHVFVCPSFSSPALTDLIGRVQHSGAKLKNDAISRWNIALWSRDISLRILYFPPIGIHIQYSRAINAIIAVLFFYYPFS